MKNYKAPVLIIIDLKESIGTDIVNASQVSDTYIDYPKDTWNYEV